MTLPTQTKSFEMLKPFLVRTDKGVFIRGYDLEAEADASCAERNAVAEHLGIVTRYTVQRHHSGGHRDHPTRP